MIEFAIGVVLLGVGFIYGTRREKRHYLDILQREKSLLHVPVRADRKWAGPAQDSFLVTGSVVISSDYFKNFVAGLKTLIGGNLTGYESLMDRARREAVLRMKESAMAKGATEIINVRLESAMIDQVGTEVLAYGTAVRR